jgi:signal transduction histidine kinase/CheY-like chemotaxis protein
MATFIRRTLFWKYAAYFAGLVSAFLIISGALGGYFAYRESVAALETLQRAKAHFAATQIANFMRSVQDAVHATVTKFSATGEVEAEDLRIDLVALLRHHPSIAELHWISSDGEERFALSRIGLNVANKGHNWSADPRFLGARSASHYVGPVYFRKQTEPYVSIAGARDSAGAVLDVEVNLKYVWDVVSQAGLLSKGAAYVVDRGGWLVSHSDIELVLGKADLSRLPHVRRALNQEPRKIAAIGEARNISGIAVVSTAAPIEHLGWTVFAEQPLEEVFRPVYGSIARSVALVVIGIAAAIAAGLLLAQRMVRPIREIEKRASQLAQGQFGYGVTVQTGDELEALATQFNLMAARLQEIYVMQEARIAERTHDLAVANKAKTQFLAAASHDLRQPIHALALFVGQLSAIDLSRDERMLVEKIQSSVEALKDLLEALLDLSKLDVGAVSAQPKPFAVHDLLSRLAQEFAPSAEAKGLALILARTSLWVRSDPLLLERIFLNVISNALRYTAQGRILIGCRRRGENVEVIVADTGVGIDSSHLPNIFQEFYRAAPRHGAMSTGLGLGLAIVRRLALLLGHHITVESTPGRGTVVRLLVPRAQPQEQRPIAQHAVDLDSLRGVRVLIVDDEAPTRDAMQGLLAHWGCEVITAECGDEAVERARAQCPDVVLCDLSLAAAESGVEVVERLRRQCGSAVACAFITGESAPERIAEARAAGHPIAFKPTTPARLRAIVEHLVHSE